VNQSEPQPSTPAPAERKEGGQDPPAHSGARPDPRVDSNEVADEKASILEPDGSPSPDAKTGDESRSER
jgi:hypothetical protein